MLGFVFSCPSVLRGTDLEPGPNPLITVRQHPCIKFLGSAFVPEIGSLPPLISQLSEPVYCAA